MSSNSVSVSGEPLAFCLCPLLAKHLLSVSHAAVPLGPEKFADFVGIRHHRGTARSFRNPIVDAFLEGLTKVCRHQFSVAHEHDAAPGGIMLNLSKAGLSNGFAPVRFVFGNLGVGRSIRGRRGLD